MNKQQGWFGSFTFFFFFQLFVVSFVLSENAQAYIHDMSASVLRDTLSESVPEAFDANSLGAEDFEIVWITAVPDGVKIQISPGTLEWVRVSDFLVVPRARVKVFVTNAQNGKINNLSQTNLLTPVKNDLLFSDFPMVLNSHSANQAELSFDRDGKRFFAHFRIRFKPRKSFGDGRVFFDPSCSPYGLNVVKQEKAPGTENTDGWLYVGCRLITQRTKGLLLSGFLEVFLYWDGAPEEIKINSVPIKEQQPSVWTLKLNSRSSVLHLESSQQRFELSYFVPDPFHRVSFGLGVGPYLYTHNDAEEQLNTIAPVITIYGSYFFTENLRLVMFDATAVHGKYYSDLGVYLLSQSIKALDNRISINLLIGGHVIAFKSENAQLFRTGLPQGFELVFRDFLFRGYNLGAGAFIFPPIKDQIYYNLWLRWGKGGFFGEINYIGWQEKAIEQRTYTRSLGLTIGFPIARFF